MFYTVYIVHLHTKFRSCCFVCLSSQFLVIHPLKIQSHLFFAPLSRLSVDYYMHMHVLIVIVFIQLKMCNEALSKVVNYKVFNS